MHCEKSLVYGSEEPHKASASGFVQFIDTGICQNLGEDMADLVLQDEVDVVTVQVGVLGKDLLGPCGVLLQRFGILGGGYAGHQCVGQIKQLLLQAAGQNGQTHDLDEADVLFFDVMILCMRMVNTERAFVRRDVVAQCQIEFERIAHFSCDRRDRVVRLAVGLGVNECRLVRICAPLAKDVVRKIDYSLRIGAS